jgi:hypothetical protein
MSNKYVVLYLHGFNSAGFGTKVNYLRATFGDENVINPNLPINTEKAIKFLDFLVKNLKNNGEKKLILVGSSQGGFYALFLCFKYNVPTILINPMIRAGYPISESRIRLTNLKTKEIYDYKKEYSEFLQKLEIDKEKIKRFQDKIFIYIDEGDTVLDWRKTVEFFEGFYVKKFPHGSHYFEHMKDLTVDLKKNVLKYIERE